MPRADQDSAADDFVLCCFLVKLLSMCCIGSVMELMLSTGTLTPTTIEAAWYLLSDLASTYIGYLDRTGVVKSG